MTSMDCRKNASVDAASFIPPSRPEAGAFDLREQFICFFDFSSCPRQTGLAKPRPFLRKLPRDLYVQQSKRDHPCYCLALCA